MCGICGIINNNKTKDVQRDILVTMTDSLVHRGPNEEGYFLKENVGLGMRRLSIIDVKGGHQPIYNEDKTVCMVCNAEIYNYLELRRDLEKKGHHFSAHSDVEVIVHLYEEDSESFIDKLRGMFAIAIYDLNKNKLLLVRDRLGIKPIYYTYQKGVFLFASELKALLKHPDLEKELSLEALSDYLTYLYIPAPETIFKNIYKLPPAHALILKNGEISLKQYWEIDYRKQREDNEQYYAERLRDLLKETVKMHLMSEVPLGAFLSGGMDSSSVVALMSEVSSDPVKTFSVGFDISDYNELKYAKLVAERFRTEHYEINLRPDIIKILPKIVKQFDEPFADSSAIPTYLISEFAKRKVTVCLAGDGGDELFAGYGWTRRQKFISEYNRLPGFIRSNLKATLLNKSYIPDRKNRISDKLRRFIYDANTSLENSFLRRKTCFSEDMKKELFKDGVYRKMEGYGSADKVFSYFNKTNIENELERLLYLDTKMYLPDDCLCKVDMMSMTHSLEVRVPFLDHRVVEFVASLPFEYKMRGRVSKYILKKVMKDSLPEEITRQRKLGFSLPLNAWLREKLSPSAGEFLLSEDSEVNSFLNKEYMRWMVREHIEGRQDFGAQIYALIVLEIWLRTTTCEVDTCLAPVL